MGLIPHLINNKNIVFYKFSFDSVILPNIYLVKDNHSKPSCNLQKRISDI